MKRELEEEVDELKIKREKLEAEVADRDDQIEKLTKLMESKEAPSAHQQNAIASLLGSLVPKAVSEVIRDRKRVDTSTRLELKKYIEELETEIGKKWLFSFNFDND
jgi:FtsZ-binding cell division protein ZapB